MTYRREIGTGARRFLLALLISHFSFLISYAQDGRKYDAFFLDAICQQEKGNLDAAFDLLSHCVEIDSTRSEAHYYLGKYYMAMKQKDKALAHATRAAQIEPDNATYQETLANMYIGNHQYDKATAALERLYATNRDREDVLGMLVQLYEQQQDYDNAIDALARLEVVEGKSERLSFAKSQLYTAMGNKQAAIAEMKKLADEYPYDQNYRCLYANALYQNDQQKKAVTLYEDILQAEPDNRNAQLAMLDHYINANDSVHAAELTERALLNKNMTQQDRVAILRQVISDNERQGGDSTRVLQLFRRLLDAPDNASARLQLVSYAWQAANKDRVISLCQEARQYNPDEMAFYYYQGIAYYQKEQLDDALNAFQNGISVITEESNPEIVSDFYAVMGDILHQKGKEQEAYAAYDSCLVWKDDNIGCLNNYAYYLSEKGQQLDKAEQMSYRTIKAEPKNATYLDTYAWILFMQQRYSEAKVYIDQTLQCDSDTSAVLLEHAGDIYYHTGDKEKAITLWQQALDRASEKSEVKDDRRQILIRKIKLKKYLKE